MISISNMVIRGSCPAVDGPSMACDHKTNNSCRKTDTASQQWRDKAPTMTTQKLKGPRTNRLAAIDLREKDFIL